MPGCTFPNNHSTIECYLPQRWQRYRLTERKGSSVLTNNERGTRCISSRLPPQLQLISFFLCFKQFISVIAARQLASHEGINGFSKISNRIYMHVLLVTWFYPLAQTIIELISHKNKNLKQRKSQELASASNIFCCKAVASDERICLYHNIKLWTFKIWILSSISIQGENLW